MKSILSNSCCKKKKEKPFPKLMKADGTQAIYLMATASEGVRVHGGENNLALGSYSNSWATWDFKDYEGGVCLTNEEP